MSIVINVHDAKTHLSRLLDQAHAGQEIILAKGGKPYARLMPLARLPARRQPGRLAGKVDASFFDVLPDGVSKGPSLRRLRSPLAQNAHHQAGCRVVPQRVRQRAPAGYPQSSC